jgi:tRNA threonylcarbamoyl adenosine modification protein YjeE
MKLFTRETLPEEITILIDELKIRKINLVLLSGDLGYGKTTSVQVLAQLLGVVDAVLSPTFVLLKRYKTTDEVFTTLVHVDAYRVTDGTLFNFLELQSILTEAQTLVCVEWPEQIPELSNFPHALVQLGYSSAHERSIDISFSH